ncbi:putative cytochrome P450 [Helianthus annuus]|uniref:Cytochrome P450 n=1 Tax=Helianthus annuus TaxID=4232 RepID=A0A251T704_HELAN|nr:probable (S)-N-methylcoclaurine 3'-hydroxylase isozyme 2 [Helianthus annuus]KAF5780010.1 putative cytochrome P450 [Helianthus annuus]
MNLIILLVPWPLIFILYRLIINRASSKDTSLPPGPYPWPIIGNIFQIGKKNPHVRLAEMAQLYGPLISLRVGQRVLIVGSSSDAASEILRTHDHVLSGRDVSRLLQNKKQTVHNMNLAFTSECDDNWRFLRNIYKTELLSGKALESGAKMREKKVMEMVKYLASKEGQDIVIKDVVFVTAMNNLGNALLSIDLVDYEGNGIGRGVMDAIRRLIMLIAQPQLADMFPIFGPWDLQGWYKQVMHIIEHDLGSVWEDSLQKKRNRDDSGSSPKDFVDVLIEKGFSNQRINALMEELFAAGTETTGLTTEWFVAELLKNEEAMKKVRDEVTKQINGNVVKESDLVRLPYLEACFKETLRLHPAGPLLIPRKAVETCEIMGYTIPKDSQVLVNVWAINRDPKIWDDPLRFKPERFIGSNVSYKGNEFGYLPFGSGRRMCPGETMASKLILLTVASLVINFDWFIPDKTNPMEINMDEEMDIAMYKKEPLHVIFKLNNELFKN